MQVCVCMPSVPPPTPPSTQKSSEETKSSLGLWHTHTKKIQLPSVNSRVVPGHWAGRNNEGRGRSQMELHFTSHSTNLLDFSNPGALLCARGKTKENNNKNRVPVFPSAAKICECWKNADKVQSEGLHAGIPLEASGHESPLVQHYSNLGG